MPKRKPLTQEQAESRYQQAISAAENLMGDSELAGEIESAGIDAWLESKGYTVKENPSTRRVNAMANDNTLPTDLGVLTKPELAGEVQDAEETLDAIWDHALVTDDPDYEGLSDSEKIEWLEEAIDAICDECNAYDAERFPVDETDEDEHELTAR